MTKACAKKPATRSTKVVKKPCMRKPCAFIPKKGFPRMCKRPAQKKPAMADVPYTRSTSKVGKIRRDRIQPKRTILDFTVAQGHKSVIAMLSGMVLCTVHGFMIYVLYVDVGLHTTNGIRSLGHGPCVVHHDIVDAGLTYSVTIHSSIYRARVLFH